MKISELARSADVSIPTIKFYLRQGLVAPGRALSATRAEYDESHLERIRLIRALVDGAGLSIAAVSTITLALDHPPPSRHELYGIAQRTIPALHGGHPVDDTVRELVAALGWDVDDDAPALHALSGALDAAGSAGIHPSPEALERYARASRHVAEVDVDLVGGAPSAGEALTTVVVGTVMLDPVLSALRRLAQEDVSARTPER